MLKIVVTARKNLKQHKLHKRRTKLTESYVIRAKWMKKKQTNFSVQNLSIPERGSSLPLNWKVLLTSPFSRYPLKRVPREGYKNGKNIDSIPLATNHKEHFSSVRSNHPREREWVRARNKNIVCHYLKTFRKKTPLQLLTSQASENPPFGKAFFQSFITPILFNFTWLSCLECPPPSQTKQQKIWEENS